MNACNATSDNEFLDELLGDFLDESVELLAQLNQHLLHLDEWVGAANDPSEKCDATILNEMFRSAHSLKGLSAMLGFENITGLTHKVENVFDAARNDLLPIESQMIDLIFQAVDRLDAMVDCIKNASDEEVDCLSVLDGIQSLLDHSGAERPASSQSQADAFFAAGNDAAATEGPVERAAESTIAAAGVSEITTEAETPAVDAGEKKIAPVPSSPQKQAAAASESASKVVETLRVDVERLDRLMNLAGQLINNKVRFTRVGSSIKNATVTRRGVQSLKKMHGTLAGIVQEFDRCEEAASGMADMEVVRRHVCEMQTHLDIVNAEFERMYSIRTAHTDLTQAVHDLERVSSGIQKTVMDARMVPVGPLFSRFRRVIRDIGRTGGKEIELVIRGENTELDKRMIDELADPLTHMIRNSADHGIETPETRIAAGKPSLGTISLDAFHSGNSIVIQVTDNGKGLDPNKIREKAIEKQLASQAELDGMSNPEIYRLIWEPGFSTAESVTDVSGRGMGMDIVRSKIEALSGSVELESTPGVGSAFSIKLPLTMAIMPCLLVEIESDAFAIPIDSVVEIIRVESNDVATVHGKHTAYVRGEPISIVALKELFRWNGNERAVGSQRSSDDPAVVIVRDENRQIGLVVDKLLGEDEVVVKSLGENYCDIAGICGANILGDGRISLILDVPTLIATSLQTTG